LAHNLEPFLIEPAAAYHYTDRRKSERGWLNSEMASDSHSILNWKTLFRVPGFPFFFFAMFISLFGTGMNFAGVTWYVLGATHSTVKVSLVVILVTLPGLVVPPFGGVLIDRVDRRYLGVTLDAARAVIVLGTAALAHVGRLAMWELYAMGSQCTGPRRTPWCRNSSQETNC
jgi:hypothetical protein